MNTLEDAWSWYQGTRTQLRLIQRLGELYWDHLPWDKGLLNDNQFRDVDGAEVASTAESSLSHLDDLAVVVLFSVFESLVRRRVFTEVQQEAGAIKHRVLRRAVEEAQHKIAEGSFFHVLELFKDTHADLVEQVHQVRRYRNWVAHGRKGTPRDNVQPAAAYRRLLHFLQVLSAGPSETR